MVRILRPKQVEVASPSDTAKPARGVNPLHVLQWVVTNAAAFFLAAVVVDVLVGVVARYALHISLPWNEEVARYLLVWLSFLGAASAAASRVTIRVDTVIGLFKTGPARLVLEGVVGALSIVALGIFIWASRGLFGPSSSTVSPGSGISAFWVDLALPVAAVLMIIFIFCDLLRIIFRGEVPEPPDEFEHLEEL